jgi:hypothetical protein
MPERKLYVEYRIYFDPTTNQDILHECAEVVQQRLHDVFNGTCEDGDDLVPSDVTYEVVMEVENGKGEGKEAETNLRQS